MYCEATLDGTVKVYVELDYPKLYSGDGYVLVFEDKDGQLLMQEVHINRLSDIQSERK